jgi:branched-subunit amino acid aminotransferase/4-amino-4-deoxychorismate lyase
MSAVVSDVRRNETSPLSRVKSLNCLDNVLARERARRQGADEALLLNGKGMVAEGSASNLFIVDGEGLTTPGIESGALPGITRAAVIELAAEAGIACRESNLALDDLPAAKEAFLTGSIMGVMPLTRLDGSAIGDGRPGPVTGLMQRLYQRLVERETGGRNAAGES